MSETLKYNLQFFADEGDTGAEVPEIADPVESEVAENEVDEVEETEVEEAEEPEPQVDRNAIAAAARREAEARLKERDAEFVRRFGHLKNPMTGKPVQSERDYLEALDAQETLKRNRELESKGIDPKMIDRAIANNPVVRQAEEVIRQNKMQMLDNDINDQIKQISQLDPSIKSLEELSRTEGIDTIIDMVKKGYSIVDAYKLVNYNNLMDKKSAAAEQRAINQAKGKSHLTPTTSGSTTKDGMKDIPANQIDKWKAFFPDASMKELKEKYNRTHRE